MLIPKGPTGNWRQVFGDEFNGGILDKSKWFAHDGKIMNNVNTSAENVSVVNGELRLKLSNLKTGAMVCTSTIDGIGRRGFELPVGGVAEARVLFAGNSFGKIYNWPAWWAVSDPWAAGGEHDIAEALGGNLCVNYHRGLWPNNTKNYGAAVPGSWANAWHTYTLHRKPGSADVYWDSKRVATYATNDNGDGEGLTLNIGVGDGPVLVGGLLRVSYVRAWVPA